MSSESLRPDGEPNVTANSATNDNVYEVSPRYGSVQLKDLPALTQEVLTRFDRNGDGEVDEVELEGVVDVLVREQFKGRLFLCGIMMVVFALVLLLASSFGLTWAVVALHKDTMLRGKLMVRKHSSDPIQLGNSEFMVTDSGALVARSSPVSAAGAPVLGTYGLYLTRTINANMTTRLLNTLTRVHVNGSNGGQVGFRVTGFAVLEPPGTPPELHISTPTGVLVLVGDKLSSYSAAAGLLDTDELQGQSVTGIFAG